MISFIETKSTNSVNINNILAESTLQNQFANGGPAVKAVEGKIKSLIHDANSMYAGMEVVLTSSGTSALQLLCSAEEIRSKKSSFRWVTSAFNFFSANIGRLHGSLIRDCDSLTGALSFKELEKTDLDSYDGVIFTNIFAAASDSWLTIQDFCHKNNKIIVIDNATGLFDRAQRLNLCNANEIISFHHTKPWGMGEGGCLICDDEIATIARKLKNFGSLFNGKHKQHSGNHKISDFSAAYILERLNNIESWVKAYKEQEQNIISIVDRNFDDIKAFNNTCTKSPRAFTPFISDLPVTIKTSNNDLFPIRKYYKPIDDNEKIYPESWNLFNRILCVPNNPLMSGLTEQEIVEQIKNSIQK